jgi:hypothetical protein
MVSGVSVAVRTDIQRTGPDIHVIVKRVWPGQRPFR